MPKTYNPLDVKSRKRLYTAIDYSRRQLKPFRDKRTTAIKQFVGMHYSNNGSKEHVPVNLIAVAVQIYARLLAARQPRAMVETKHSALKRMARLLEIDLNHVVHEIDLRQTLQETVVNAIFSVGIVKIGTEFSGDTVDTELGAYLDTSRRDLGMPYVETVSLDDWVQDMGARRFEECAYYGNRYRIPLEAAKDFPGFDKAAREDLKATHKTPYFDDGDAKTENISRGDEADPDEYRDYVELWDLYLPMEDAIVTLPVGGDGEKAPLMDRQWDGPEGGSFLKYGFQEVPDQDMPLPPVSMMMDIHRLTNSIFCKLADQAEREKTLLLVQKGAAKDAEMIVKASDGDTITVDNPAGSREAKYGGVSQPSMALAIWLRDLFSWQSGNLDSLGGLGPQSDTASQDKMIGDSTSKHMAEMQERTVLFAEKIMNQLAWYEWTEPFRERVLKLDVAGVEIPVRWSPDIREGDFLDYNIKVHPYSMTHQTPDSRLQTLRQVLREDILPMLPMLAQEGITLNAEGILKTIGHYADMPDLEEIIRFTSSMPEAPIGSSPQGMPKPAVTTRNVVRTNRSGATRQGKDMAMIGSMLGAKPQAAEAGRMLRPTG